MADLKIRFTNWDKYNPRKDVKCHSWFRFEHGFFENPNFYDLNPEEKLTFVYILCERSKRENDEFFTVNSLKYHRCTGINTTVLNSTIKKLSKEQVLEMRTLRGRYASVTRTCSTDERTNGRTVQTEVLSAHDSSESDRTAIAELLLVDKIITPRGVPEKLQRSWLETFPDVDWIVLEIRKANAWELSNSKRKKKNFGAFITRWLTKGWDERKISSISKPPSVDLWAEKEQLYPVHKLTK